MTKIEALRAALPKLGESDRGFANSLLSQYGRRGDLSPKQWPFVDKLITRASAPVAPPVQLDDVSGILGLFAKAKRHLKFPAIVLAVPALGPDTRIRLTVAGEKAKPQNRGTINITDGNRDEEGQRSWLGRITLDGFFKPSEQCINALAAPAIAERLKRFAADPATGARENAQHTLAPLLDQDGKPVMRDGKAVLVGRCCFCNTALSDERSTVVGYGPVCAGRYDLPWGDGKPVPTSDRQASDEFDMFNEEPAPFTAVFPITGTTVNGGAR